MFISHKSNVIQTIHETEWQCRRNVKGLSKPEYWTWIGTITSEDENGNDVVTYPSEDFTIVECTDEDVQARLSQLSEYKAEGVYNIKWSDSKVSAVTGQNEAGEDITIQTHFSGDDTAKDARLLADKWTEVRRYRDADLVSSDWTILDDSPLSNAKKIKWQTYRQSLRDVPSQSDPDDITWPSKP